MIPPRLRREVLPSRPAFRAPRDIAAELVAASQRAAAWRAVWFIAWLVALFAVLSYVLEASP